MGDVSAAGIMTSGGTGTTDTPIKRAVINESTAASNEIIALVAGRQIVLTKIVFVTTAAQSITLQSVDAVPAATAMTGVMAFGANGGLAMDCKIELTTAEAFNILQSAAVQLSGWVEYYEK